MKFFIFVAMKNILFLILFTPSSYIFAQSFGSILKLGVNFSQVDGDQLGGYNKVGINPGVEINRRIDDKWIGAFEIRYSAKGAKKVLDPELPDTYLKLSYHYIEIPVLAKYQFDKFQGIGGISFGVNVFNQRDDNGIVGPELKLKKTEMALHLGASYNFSKRWGAEIRHSYSMSSIRDQSIIVIGPTWFGRAGWYNRLFTVSLNYTLDKNAQ